MTVSFVNTNSNNENNAVNKAASNKETKQNALVQTSSTVAEQQVGSSKKSKIRPQKDIGNQTHHAARGSKGKPSLFSVWSGDALSLFMFNVAPLILQLNFSLRETLSKAEQTEAENQIIAADASAKLREQQGEADCEKMRLEANASWAGGVMGLMGSLQGFTENFAANHMMENEMALQNKMISDLSTGSPKTENQNAQARGTIQAAPGSEIEMQDLAASRAERTPQEQEELTAKKERAKAQAATLKEKYEEQVNALRDQEKGRIAKAKEAIGRSKWFGLNKSSEIIEHENDLAISRLAGKAAHTELMENPDYVQAMKDITENPEVAAEFMKSLGTPEEAINTLRGMPSDIRSNTLRSFAKSEESAVLKQHLNNQQERIEILARHERSTLDSAMQKRQIISQAITGFTTAASQTQQTDEILDAAAADSESKEWDAEASVMASVRGAQDGTISGALQQVQGLMDWYAQMESQVIGAVTQSMA